MNILEAFDLTHSYRSAAALCGVDHQTVRRDVAARSAGLDPTGDKHNFPSYLDDSTKTTVVTMDDAARNMTTCHHQRRCLRRHHPVWLTTAVREIEQR